MAEHGGKGKWTGDADGALGGQGDTVGEAFALDEPFIYVDCAGAVEQGCA